MILILTNSMSISVIKLNGPVEIVKYICNAIEGDKVLFCTLVTESSLPDIYKEAKANGLEFFSSTFNDLIYILAWHSKLSKEMYDDYYDLPESDITVFLESLHQLAKSLDAKSLDKTYLPIAVLVQDTDRFMEMLKEKFGPHALFECATESLISDGTSTERIRLVIASTEAVRRATEIHHAHCVTE